MKRITFKVIAAVLFSFALQARGAQMKVLGFDTQALQARIDLIKNAKEEILAEYYEVDQDRLMVIGLGLLQEAAQRGVKVKLIVDSMHSQITRPQFAAMMNTLNAIGRTKNFEIKVFNPLDNLKVFDQTYRNHDKLLVVDGKYAIIGGRNISGTYFGRAEVGSGKPNLRDCDVLSYGTEVGENKVIDGEVHLSPRNYFLTLWSKNAMVKERALYEVSSEELTGNCFLKNAESSDFCERQQEAAVNKVKKEQAEIDAILTAFNSNMGEPTKESFGVTARAKSEEEIQKGMYQVDMTFMYSDPTKLMNQIEDGKKLSGQLFQLISSLRPKQMTLVTPYLFPPQLTLDLFKDLANNNGTKIKIISNSLNSTDSTLVQAGYESIKPQLLGLGSDFEMYEYNGPLNAEKQPTILHAKMMVMDEETESPTILIGSFNMDYRSAYINREIGVKIYGKEVKSLAKDILHEMSYIQRASTRSDGSAESNRILNEMATPEKRQALKSDKKSLILKYGKKQI